MHKSALIHYFAKRLIDRQLRTQFETLENDIFFLLLHCHDVDNGVMYFIIDQNLDIFLGTG